MVWLHFIFLFAIIIYAAKLGGIGVGMEAASVWRSLFFFSAFRRDPCLST